jgi:hypothetical protein
VRLSTISPSQFTTAGLFSTISKFKDIKAAKDRIRWVRDDEKERIREREGRRTTKETIKRIEEEYLEHLCILKL